MKKITSLLLLIICWTGIAAQNIESYSSIDEMMLRIPGGATNSTKGIADYINSNWVSQSDKLRAIFIWIATNIDYEVTDKTTIWSDQNSSDINEKTLRTRKGVCLNYTELFNDIANRVGIKTYMVTGYTKQNGSINSIPHAWSAASIDDKWYLFDPTWGAGYIQKGKFTKEINNSYCKMLPEQMIRNHIPFDPLFQFLYHPITYQAFYDDDTNINSKNSYFNFKDSLLVYERQSEIEKLIASTYRIQQNGVKNSLIDEELQINRHNISYFQEKQVSTQFNTAVNDFNKGVRLLNQFIQYRNKQFSPERTDLELKQMIDSVEIIFNSVRDRLNRITNSDLTAQLKIRQLDKSLISTTNSLNEQKIFLNKYFNTGKTFRKALFYKSKKYSFK
jgi:transglutaminase/protease-like cytokinesis protein 3